MKSTANSRLIKAYEMGLKDVISFDVNEKTMEYIETMKKKKCYRKLVKINNRTGTSYSYLFFRKREDRDYFMKNIKEHLANFTMYNVATEFGLLLGFPPKACSLFPKKVYNVDRPSENIKIDYNGIVFASYPESIEEDLLWLFENKPVKEGYLKIADKEYLLENEKYPKTLTDMIFPYIAK